MREFPEIALPNPANPATEQIRPFHNMKTPTELRPIANRAILAIAGLMPFTHGSGRDSHGAAVPDAEAVVRRGLMELVEAGRLANAALEDSDAMAGLPCAMPWLL